MQMKTRCALLAGALTCAMSAAPADVSKSSQGTAPKASGTNLAQYYHAMQTSFLSRGLMKTARTVPNAPMDVASLSQDFLEIAMLHEYGRGFGASGSRSPKPLLRWEDPVRLQVVFGRGVDKSRRARDLRAISDYAGQLSRATRHSIKMTSERPNFHVLVVSEAERKSLGKVLPQLVPGISASTVRTISRMRPNHLCMVVAEPHADRSRGFRAAVAIVRAEHPDQMRAACIQEELAQGLGLSNDCDEAWPSIFNDDQEFAVLTRRDEKLLGMLYDPRLRSGMTADEVKPYLHAVASAQF